MSASKVIVVIVAVLVIGGLLWFILIKNAAPQTVQTDETTAGRSIPVATQPTQTPISKQVPVTISSVRGTVLSVDKNSISIKTSTETTTLTFSSTTDFQKITSGVLEKGDAVTATAKLTDVVVGQEVMAVINKGASVIRSLVIIK